MAPPIGGARRSAGRGRAAVENEILDGLSADAVLLDDALHFLPNGIVVPHAIGLHAYDRAALAGGDSGHAGTLGAQFAAVLGRAGRRAYASASSVSAGSSSLVSASAAAM